MFSRLTISRLTFCRLLPQFYAKERMFVSTEKNPTAAETMHEFMSVGRAHRAAIDKMAAQMEIHPAQHRLLTYLQFVDTPPSQKDLCDHFAVSAATVAVAVAKLQKRGLVEKYREDGDNRVNRIRLTGEGKELLKKTKSLFARCDEMAFRNFSQEELSSLLSLLSKMKHNIETIHEPKERNEA